MEKITMENFSEWNRDRIIGHSQYRICRNKDGYWYIQESFNNVYDGGNEWCVSNNFYTKELKELIEKINSFTKEKEVISLKF